MQFSNYWQQFEHTGRVEDYLSYLYHTAKETGTDTVRDSCQEDCRAQGGTDLAAGEEEPCRNPCM